MPFGDGRRHFGMLAQIRLLVEFVLEFVLEGVLDGYGGAVRLGFRLSQALSARLPLFRGLACRCDFFAHRFVPVGRNEMLSTARARSAGFLTLGSPGSGSVAKVKWDTETGPPQSRRFRNALAPS